MFADDRNRSQFQINDTVMLNDSFAGDFYLGYPSAGQIGLVINYGYDDGEPTYFVQFDRGIFHVYESELDACI